MQNVPAILLGSGLRIAVLAIVVGSFVFPKIIESKISQHTAKLVQCTETYKKWENLAGTVYYTKVYIFNVTNPKEIMEGAKPKLQEVGPYVYQQKRVKTDIEVKEENDTIFYRQIKTYFFRSDMSKGAENDVVTIINLPFVAMATAVKSAKMTAVGRNIIVELMKDDFQDEPVFVDRTVSQLLFQGYKVPFVAELEKIAGNQILPNNTFGMFYGKNGTDGDELEVYAGVKDNSKFGQIARWKNESSLDFWTTEYCNMINGSDGTLFPPFVSADRVLDIFTPELCRSLYLTYKNTVEILGIPGYRFTLPKILLEDPLTNPDNMCYCTDPGKDYENCPKGGVYSMSSCKKGAPSAVSLPHFLDANPYYLNQLEGLNPQREKHETEIILEPNTGVLLRSSKRIQGNIELKPSKYFPALKELPEITLPIVWVDESAALTEEEATKIKAKLCHEKDKCKGRDSYGVKWEACPGETVRRKCSNTSTPGENAYWSCSASGIFNGEQPDYSECSSQELINIETTYFQNGFFNISQTIKGLENVRKLVTTPEIGSKGAKYYGHEIEKIYDIVENATVNVKGNFSEQENVTTEAIGILANLIATATPWGQLNTKNKSEKATKIISSLENTLFRFAKSSNETIFKQTKSGLYKKKSNPIDNDPKGFEVTLALITKGIQDNYIKFPEKSNSSYIAFKDDRSYQNETTTYVGIMMDSKYMENLTAPLIIKNGRIVKKYFNGKIISFTFKNITIHQGAIKNGVIVKIVHDIKAVGITAINFTRKLHPGDIKKAVFGKTECTYWDTKLHVWSTDGCKKLELHSNHEQTLCNCTHLTAFAILTDVHGYIGKDKGLENLTLTLCPLSIFCLIATIVMLTKIKALHGEQSTLVKHLCANLFLGDLLMLLFVDKNYFYLHEHVCAAVGMLTHYIYLSAFGWMAAQGHFFYRMFVVIFPTARNYMPYYIIGAYCYPLISIGITVAISYGVGDRIPYGGDEMFCWLNGNYIWAFMGPIAVILLGNFIVKILAMQKVGRKFKSNSTPQKEIASNRKWIKGSLTLSILLGLTWTTAFFTLMDDPSFPFLSYLFTIFNASQGVFILLYYCLLHQKVKPLVFDKMRKLRILLSKEDKKHPVKANEKQTTYKGLSDTQKDLKSTQSQSVPNPDHEEHGTKNFGNVHSEISPVTKIPKYDDGYHQELSPCRKLSIVLESNLECERKDDENELLFKTDQQEYEIRKGNLLEEESESEFSDRENGESDEINSSMRRRRRVRGLPYMDELLASNLFLARMSPENEERLEMNVLINNE